MDITTSRVFKYVKSYLEDSCFFKHLLWDTGGWNQEKKRLRKATVVPNDYANAQNFGEGRVCAPCVCSSYVQSALCSLDLKALAHLSVTMNLYRMLHRSRCLSWNRGK